MFKSSDILNLWFSAPFESDASLKEKSILWFSVNKQNDTRLRRYTLSYINMAAEDFLNEWQCHAHGNLALCLLLDRISRSCYRGLSFAYDNDEKAQSLSLDAISNYMDHHLTVIESLFLIFPLIASEKVKHQHIALNKLQQYLVKATDKESEVLSSFELLIHRNLLVLERFSRFPHRAKQLQKTLSSTEQEFVKETEWQYWL